MSHRKSYLTLPEKCYNENRKRSALLSVWWFQAQHNHKNWISSSLCHSSILLQWKQGRIQKVNETRSDQNPVHKVSLWISADFLCSLWACSHTIPPWITARVVKISLPWETCQCPHKRVPLNISDAVYLSFLKVFKVANENSSLDIPALNKILNPQVQKQHRLYRKRELLLPNLRTKDTSGKCTGWDKRRQELLCACPAFALTNTNSPFHSA